MSTHTIEKGGENPSKVVADICKKYIASCKKDVMVVPMYLPIGLIVQELLMGECFRVPEYDRIQFLNRLELLPKEFLRDLEKLKTFNGLVVIADAPKDPEDPIAKSVAVVVASNKCDTVLVQD